MISLRGGELRVLALRGTVWVDSIEEDDLSLEAGQILVLAEGVSLTVCAVELPDEVLAIQLDGGRPMPLRMAVYSLVLLPQPELIARYLPQAAARLWSTAEGWAIQVDGAAPKMIKPGRSWKAGDLQIVAVTVSARSSELATTLNRPEPLHIVARHTTVHIHRPRRTVVTVDGLRGRLLSELVVMGCPAPWETIAEGLWPDEANRTRLRRRWDRIRQRLTALLRDSGIREDLVRTDGQGNFELLLMAGDVAVDES
ncbi:MAG: hypothetical protein ACI8S6_002633 [Myxococcota bacterium]|jgi:hypothetical protein